MTQDMPEGLHLPASLETPWEGRGKSGVLCLDYCPHNKALDKAVIDNEHKKPVYLGFTSFYAAFLFSFLLSLSMESTTN